MAVEPKVAVITGASRGLGAGLAAAFAHEGIALGLCSRTCEARTEEQRVQRPVDVSDRSAMEEFVAHVVEHLGPIDLWINNAGLLAPIGPLRDNNWDEVTALLDTNLRGAWIGTQLFVQHLHRTGRPGVLVNISSGAARQAVWGWSAYCASKAALERMTECVALEEESHGLRAYSVAPGVVDTSMQAMIRSTPADKFPGRDRFLELKELGRFNTPEHVARYILALTRGEISNHQVAQRVPNMHE